jgi:hypothetical protein
MKKIIIPLNKYNKLKSLKIKEIKEKNKKINLEKDSYIKIQDDFDEKLMRFYYVFLILLILIVYLFIY